MKPAAGVIPTQPTTIAVAAPIAVTWRERSRSSTNQVASAHAGVSSVLTNASTLPWPVEKPDAAVEAEPAEPQQAGAEQHVDRVVRQQRLAPVVLARADDQRRRQRGEAGAHLDRDAAGEVQRALRPSASRRPTPSARARRRRAPTTARRRPGTAPKRIRSTTAPATSAVVRMQNVAWKAKKSRCGIVVPSRGSKSIAAQERVVEPADDRVALREGERVADQRPA